ncbi:hypothetical protein EVAR_71484_1 [Eumeta japonica]|uniref:Uncharacterized protein n=1 Tax=Eumeta variegata TaxID=151549 RepID=A0A4C2AGD6_EUMVA|nr:hypothetical protein EVAR_71484_1 [Eumeta japonica]
MPVGVSQDVEHVFFACSRISSPRNGLETVLRPMTRAETLVEAMIASKDSIGGQMGTCRGYNSAKGSPGDTAITDSPAK